MKVMVKKGAFRRCVLGLFAVATMTACGSVEDGTENVDGELSSAPVTPRSFTGEAAINLLQNAGFEDGCASWRSCTLVSSPRRGGVRAAQEALSPMSAASVAQTVPAVAGSTYSATAWISVRDICQTTACVCAGPCPQPSVCSLRVVFRDRDGKSLGHVTSEGISWASGPSWQQRVVTGTAPAGTRHAQLVGRCTAGTGEYAYFDDFSFVQATSVTAQELEQSEP